LFAVVAIWRATVDEDGNIVSPWHYPVEADLTLRESKRRRPTIPYYAQCQVRADVRAA